MPAAATSGEYLPIGEDFYLLESNEIGFPLERRGCSRWNLDFLILQFSLKQEKKGELLNGKDCHIAHRQCLIRRPEICANPILDGQ